jgi:HPt (histidine-containing phosphotransfer) domain-containing protein
MEPLHDDHVDEELLAEVLMMAGNTAADGILKACDLFRSSVPHRLNDIGSALGEGRLDDAAQTSHSLRGSAGAFGAKRLSMLGMRLEAACRQSDLAGAEGLLAEMRGEFVVFRDIFDARLARVRSSGDEFGGGPAS